jgi:hypothetical protein
MRAPSGEHAAEPVAPTYRPSIVGANINATVLAIAERAAALIGQ